ncbi:MAG: T9SS type A sorting domain-containing protein [bacterium]
MKIYKNSFLALILLFLVGTASATIPKNVQITNVTDNQFIISWITDVNEIGYIMWGTNTGSLSERALDIRDTGTPTIQDDTHYVKVMSNSTITIGATTTYYYQIVSGTQTSGVGSVTTGVEKTSETKPGVYGYVYKWGPNPATGTIVYLMLQDADGTSTLGTSALYSELILSPDGGWVALPANFRIPDLSDFFDYSDNDNLWIYTEGANDGTATLTLKIGSSSPTPDIIIPPDTIPPGTPTVIDDGIYSTRLYATWQAQDGQSGIIEYMIAIGTTQGGTDTLDWKSVGTETEFIGMGTQGLTYYFSVKAKDRAGWWSPIGYSNGVTIVGPSPHLPAKIPVYPNPFIPSKHNSITFGGINEGRLTKEVTIKIFTIAGELVDKIERTDCNGQIQWTLSHNLASGIYIYLITNPQGEQAKGKLGIIR